MILSTLFTYSLLYFLKLATLVEGYPKAPFSTATAPRWRGGRYSLPWIALLYPRALPNNAVLSKAASSTIFLVFGMTRPGIEPRFFGPLGKTLFIRPMARKAW